MAIALITGSSRGLGKSMAQHLARSGTDIIVTYHAQQAEADKLVAELRELDRKAVALQLDVAQHETFAAFARQVGDVLQQSFGQSHFDYLVNNAGVGEHVSIAETTPEQFDRMMNIHLKAPFFLSQKLLPLMNDGGKILNISSGLARFSYQGYAAYAIMKGGVEVFTRYLAQELGPRGITVNTLAPGAIETDFGGGAVRDNADLNKMIAAQTSLGRVGLPDDIGGAAAALLTGTMGWVNGQRIEASGGIHL